jgi:hypothetical protein
MSERIKLLNLRLKISFRFEIETRADQNFTFRFDLETKRCLFSSCAVRETKIKQRLIFQINKGKKERNIRFFMIESNKQIAFVHKKTKR